MDMQSSPIIEDESSRIHNKKPQTLSESRLDWWDLLPLVEEPQNTPAIHWTPHGIITAHPTKPILLLYPQPPSTTERKTFPSDRRISESDGFVPARILSVSGSGDHVFAYFPTTNGSNSGAWCIWVNMVLRQFWNVEQGEAVVDCWWLGNPRERITDGSNNSIRLPQIGPRIAFHSPVALLLSENFALHLVCESAVNSPPDSPLLVTTANALRATANATPRTSAGLDPYTGLICTRAAMGLAYSDSSIILAMQAALLPPPCLPLSDVQSMGLSTQFTTFVTHSSTGDWEYSGAEPTIRMCEVTLTYNNKRGMDIQTYPTLSIPIPVSSRLSHLHFVPKTPEHDSGMDIDTSDSHPSRYIVVGIVEFDTYSSLPKSSLMTYSLQKEGGAREKWAVRQEGVQVFTNSAVMSLKTAQSLYGKQTGLIALLDGLSSASGTDAHDKLTVLRIPSLDQDENFADLKLQINTASAFAISPLGTYVVSQSLKNSKQFRFYPYPGRESEANKGRDDLVHTILSSHDSNDAYRLSTTPNSEGKLRLLDAAWEMLDSENGGGGSARWSMQYLQELMLIETKISRDAEKEELHRKQAVTMDFLSLSVAKGALVECHGKDTDGPYDPDCIWPLSDICGWIMEFSESVLSAAGEFAHAIKKQASDEINQEIDRRLLILLHSTLLSAWVEALTLVDQFLKHVDGPKGSNSDNKTLVTKSVEDVVNKSPINVAALLEALKSLLGRQFPTSAEWRKAYSTCQASESLVQSIAGAVELVVTPEIVALLPLHVRMAGLNLLQTKEDTQERDVITKKPLVQSELQTLEYRVRASCLRCQGKTTIDFSTPLATSRWKRWEASFQRCICGGRWKLLT
ncbi:hypothetical protein M408DRAFT_333491 [Serendipita vermifera MAFF 305830]|uniref:Mediator complex subunit 16 n=1 Tax=Serendipita vermifera MAFF 305830 TaxID=933852 RepID=A0A0C3AQ18_SERVB|nr:hypothetical protein M408DRAFT_333491 [Serendipita vermifera MAFF 305830]